MSSCSRVPQNLDLREVKDTLAQVCGQYQGVIAAWIFGSLAKGKIKERSDVDVALLVKKEFTHHENYFDLLGFMTDLANRLGREVDAVILNKAGEVLKFEVRKHGILAYEADPEERKRFEIRSRRQYEDYLYMHRRYVSKVLYGDLSG